jgi:hypothetical protein
VAIKVITFLLGTGLVLGWAFNHAARAGSRELWSGPGSRQILTIPTRASLSSLRNAPGGRACQSEAERPVSSELAFKYTFENTRFYIPWIQLDLSPDGAGTVRFKRGESDDTLERPVKLLPATLGRIGELVARTSFLTSDEDYQSKRDFAHLGWMTISVNQGGKQRTVRFNYTDKPDISELAEIFRAIANEAIALFDIDLSIQHQPLDLPRMLESLENELRLERYAEPEQLIPMLRNIAQDDTLPLIARNSATRLIASIQKGKFKSPVKSK